MSKGLGFSVRSPCLRVSVVKTALWITVALALTGNVLIIHHMPHGFVCWIVADVILATHAFSCRHWPQATLWCVYLGIAVWGVVRWV